MDQLLIIAVLTFVGVAMLIFGAYLVVVFYKERSDLTKRIREPEGYFPEMLQDKFIPAIKGNWLKILDFLGRFVKPTGEEKPSYHRNMFLKAGIRQENAALIFFGVKMLLAVLFLCLFVLIKIISIPTMSSSIFLILSILSAATGLYLPDLWLKIRTARRKEEMFLGLPDALDLMVVCSEAGIGLDATILKVGEEMKMHNKTVSDEFNFMNLEMRAGKQRRDALKGLAMRTDLEEVDILVSLLIQTDRFGTSIAQTLRVHSDAMRVKRFQRAEEIAAKMPTKLLFPLIFFIFPSLFIVIMGPAAIRIIRVMLPALDK
ncbi:MAG: type II secretion system F family protein [Desulfobacterium sp.]|nr:type II secretion system F family protein [Desulfobacterium sp.]MBU3947280.1 type II secretion system F family protein [Pseudomonadota bacterium]MBU4035109.1 type II secretion system F family protein [Pseudomonadota bacterium]